MDTFIYAFNAVLPLLLMVGLGVFVRQVGPWEPELYRKINNLCFHVFLPIYLFCNVYQVESLRDVNWKLLLFLVFGIFASLAMGWLITTVTKQKREQKGVLIQAAFRSNHSVMGLTLAEALGGTAVLGFATVTTAVCVPLFNLLAVVVLATYSDREHRLSGKELVKEITKNPLLRAIFLGLILVALRPMVGGEPLLERVPQVYEVLKKFAAVASPLMLFVVGAGLDFRSTGRMVKQLVMGVSMRLILSPVVVVGLGLLLRKPLGLTAMELPALLAVCASPAAISSAVMTQELGGDHQLAAQLVVWSTTFSIVTVFVIAWTLRTVGFL